MATGPENQLYGKGFERAFQTVARYSGLLPIKDGQACRIIGRGRMRLIKGPLDFHVVDQHGKVGFFDLKTFVRPFFKYSQIDESQLERSLLYNERNVPSGFVCWFRKINRVSFFPGGFIFNRGPGNRFLAEEGRDLGKLESMDLKRLFL